MDNTLTEETVKVVEIDLEYGKLDPAGAVHHLAEKLAAEIDRFERATHLRVAAIKLKRVKGTDDLQTLHAHVR